MLHCIGSGLRHEGDKVEPTVRDAGKALDPGAGPATAGKEVEMHAQAEKFHFCRGEKLQTQVHCRWVGGGHGAEDPRG